MHPSCMLLLAMAFRCSLCCHLNWHEKSVTFLESLAHVRMQPLPLVLSRHAAVDDRDRVALTAMRFASPDSAGDTGTAQQDFT